MPFVAGFVHPVEIQAGSILDIANVASLKALDISGVPDKTQASIGGFWAVGDGGGGMFVYDAEASDADDGGTILAPIAGNGRWKRVYSGPVNVRWFGANGDGVTNDTTYLQRFLDFIRDGRPGHWDGEFVVSAGTLLLQPSAATAGADVVGPFLSGVPTLIVSGAADGPILRIWGKDFTGSRPGPLYVNGRIDGIRVYDPDAIVGTSRNGLSLRGLFQCTFGPLIGEGLGGSAVYIKSEDIANWDWYNTAACHFSHIEGKYCKGWALHNACGNSFNGNDITYLRASACGLGGVYDDSAGNKYSGSFGTYGPSSIVIGSSQYNSTKVLFSTLEIDDAGGICISRCTKVDIERARFLYRKTAGVTRPSAALSFSDGTPRTIDSVNIDAEILISSGCTTDQITYIDFGNNPNINNVRINIKLRDDASLGLTAANFMTYCTNLHASAKIRLTVNNIVVYDNLLNERFAIARATTSSAVAIPTSGWNTEACKLTGWDNIFLDFTSMWSAADNAFIIPFQGIWRIRFVCFVPVGAAAGEIPVGGAIRAAIAIIRSGAFASLRDYYANAATSPADAHYVDTEVTTQLVAGDKVFATMTATPNSGTAYLKSVLNHSALSIGRL